MDLIDILVSQLADPFRVGLLLALLFTARNNSNVLNRWLPLGLGLVFVAVLIPTAMASDDTAPVVSRIGLGLLSNALILGIFLLAQAAFEHVRK